MIRIMPDIASLDPASLIGKFVMRDAGVLWHAVASPFEVVSHLKSKLIVLKLYTIFNTETKAYVLHTDRNPSHGRDAEHVMLSSVRAVCDTPEEVLLLLNQGLRENEAFIAMKAAARANLLAFDGVSAPSPEEEVSTAPTR